jgi:S-DNA-T family DNA segregation ATPase FtsK/SpoIIIE
MADQQASEQAVRFLPDGLDGTLHRLGLRMFGAVLFASGFCAWLALVSWSKFDPSFSTTSGGDLRNLIGSYGALFSDLMVQTVGLGAAFMVAAPVVWGAHLMFDRPLTAGRWRVAAAALAVLSVAGGLASIPKIEAWPLVYGFGGLIGDILYNVFGSLLQPVLGPLAGALIGISGLSAGLLLFGSAVGFGHEDLRSAWRSRKSLWRNRRQAGLDGSARYAGRAPEFNRDEPVQGPDWATGSAAPDLREPSDVVQPGHPDVGADATGAPSADNHVADPLQDRIKPPDFLLKETGAGRPPPLPRGEPPHHVAVALPGDDVGPEEPLPAMFTKRRRANVATEGADKPTGAARTLTASTVMRAVKGQADRLRHAIAQISAAGVAALKRARPMPGMTRASVPAPTSEPVMAPPPPPPPPARVEPAAETARRGDDRRATSGYRPPALSLLSEPSRKQSSIERDKRVLNGQANLLEGVLADYGVQATVQDIRPGPVITLYEIEIARGIKASRVIGLADDIARSMSAPSARIAVIPGRNTLGIELPNVTRESVALREIVASPAFRNEALALPIGLGQSIDGTPVVADLARMPHLLVAGTTGSGKSVGVNAMILSLLYAHGPDRLRLLMVDPIMLELSIYNGIPHLLTPVITDPMKAVSALDWAVREMEERYKKMSELSVRNIATYNQRVRDANRRGQTLTVQVQTGFDDETGRPTFETRALPSTPMPHIVIVVDEFADLMVVAGKEIEASLQRLAQMARAAGIHLIMATQRPSVDVVTGTIKANFPARIAFKVASKVDSRTILNAQGAEQLLGQGDMLLSDGAGELNRVHGAFVSDQEVENIVAELRRAGPPRYVPGVTDAPQSNAEPTNSSAEAATDGEDLYAKAVAVVLRDRKASTSYIQRRLSIGYNRAADLIDRMEAEGLISAAGTAGKREILIGKA